jgi:UDP-N-acetylmuramyl pentapeptide phosphotransferase/UDP-N-acetylglucosamine-1-phosphate transferase
MTRNDLSILLVIAGGAGLGYLIYNNREEAIFWGKMTAMFVLKTLVEE